MDIINFLLAGGVVFLGSFFATISGFGFALVATPLLAMLRLLRRISLVSSLMS